MRYKEKPEDLEKSYYKSGPALPENNELTPLQLEDLEQSNLAKQRLSPHQKCTQCGELKPLTDENWHKFSSTGPYAGRYRRTCSVCENKACKVRGKKIREKGKKDEKWLQKRRDAMYRFMHDPEKGLARRRLRRKRNYRNHRSRGEHLINNHWVTE